ncbi:hypothetical protein BOTBODRAFT_58089 [Botryobasidium botryosum FD-172 SS1]|uniref:Uncharacterized protein n=1 Tax=Botryobasidium botryosum (strain FD-172 SS1) TaxID=930990 RepID=A0A067M3N2_BOTB1|nr:hypothetical protein BOTBODRAFT_58089 [Botryobasidium botryosum FD-172 SS1]
MGDFSPERLAQLWPSELSAILPSHKARAELPNIALDGRYDAPLRNLAIYIASDERLCIEALKSDSLAARTAAINSFAQIMGKRSRRSAAWEAIGGADGFVELVHQLSFKEVSNLAMAISKRCKKQPENEDASEELDEVARRLLTSSDDASRMLFPQLCPLLSATSAGVVREVLPTMTTLAPSKLRRLSYTHPNTMRHACLAFVKAVSTDEEKVEDVHCFQECLKDLILSRAPFDSPEAAESQQGHPGLRFALALLQIYISLIEREPNLSPSKDILYPRADTLLNIGALCFSKVGPHDIPALEEFARAITKICRLSNIDALLSTWQLNNSRGINLLRIPIRAWSLDPNDRTSSLLSSIARYISSESLSPRDSYSMVTSFLDQVPRTQRFALFRIICSSASSPLEIDADKLPPTDDLNLQRSRSIAWDPAALLAFDRARALKAYQASASVLGGEEAMQSSRAWFNSYGRDYRKVVFEKRENNALIMSAYLRSDESIVKQLKALTVKESVAEERAKALETTLLTAALFDKDELFKNALVWAFGRFTKDVKSREKITSSVLSSRLCIEAIAGVGNGWRVDKSALDSPEKLELLTRRYERGNTTLRIIVAALHKATSEPDFSFNEWQNLFILISQVFSSRAQGFERLGSPQALFSTCLESVLDIRLEAERIALFQASDKLWPSNRKPLVFSLYSLTIGRRLTPKLVALLDEFSEKRDSLYKEARIAKRADVADLPAGVAQGLPIQHLFIQFCVADKRTKCHRSPFIEARLHDILFSPYEVLQTKISTEQGKHHSDYIDNLGTALETWVQWTDGTAASIDRFVALAKHFRDVSPDGDLRGLLLTNSSLGELLQYEKTVRESFGDIWPQVPDGEEEWNPLARWPPDPSKHKLLVGDHTILARSAATLCYGRRNRTHDLFATARQCRTILPGTVRKAVVLAALHCLRQIEPFNTYLNLEGFANAEMKQALRRGFLDEVKDDNLKLRHVTRYMNDVSGDIDSKPLAEFASVVTQEQYLAKVFASLDAADVGQALDLVVSICKALQLSDSPQLAIRPSLDAIKDPEVSSRARHVLGPRILRVLRPAQVESLYEQLFGWIAAKRASEGFDIKISVLKMVTEMLRLPYLGRRATVSRCIELRGLSRHIDVQHGICKWVLQDLVKARGPASDTAWGLIDSFVAMANGITEGTSFTEERWREFESGAAALPEIDSDQRIRTFLLGQDPEDFIPDLRKEYADRVIGRLALNATANKRRYIAAFLRASGIELESIPRVAPGVSIEEIQDWIPWLPSSLLDMFESEATVHLLDTQFTKWKLDLSQHNSLWNDTPAGKQFSRINQNMASTTIAQVLVSALLDPNLRPRSDEHTISVEGLQDLLVSIGTNLLQNPRSVMGHHPLKHIRAMLTAIGPRISSGELWKDRVRPVVERIATAYESLVLESGPAIKPHRFEPAIPLLPFPWQAAPAEHTESCTGFARALAELIQSVVDEDVYHAHLPPLMALTAQKSYFKALDIIPIARALTVPISGGSLRARVIRHEWAHKFLEKWYYDLRGDEALKRIELVEVWRQDESPLISALGYQRLPSDSAAWGWDPDYGWD